MQQNNKDIRCIDVHSLLAKCTQDGIRLFCKGHKVDHLVSWEDLEIIKLSLKETEKEKSFILVNH